ncbi:MAG: DUF2975 domain-containing protein [Rikenellaceae bacterium]|jgi:hypothetical protein|nr:DUF2975 domain-containing protein [Rikenellaceae bacterium]
MQKKSIPIKRINTLYIIFFVAIIAAVGLSIAGDDFRTGFSDGRQSARATMGEPCGDVSATAGFMTVLYGIENKTSEHGYDIPLPAALQTAGVTAMARVNTIDVMLTEAGEKTFSTVWSTLLFTFSFLCYGTVFVMIFVIINSVRRSIRQEEIFERRNVLRTRVIGGLLIAASLLSSMAVWVDNRIARAVLGASPGELFTIDASIRFSFTELITAILILFIAEVFAIGYDLSQEQKLTI